jgi:hypothetical protein
MRYRSTSPQPSTSGNQHSSGNHFFRPILPDSDDDVDHNDADHNVDDNDDSNVFQSMIESENELEQQNLGEFSDEEIDYHTNPRRSPRPNKGKTSRFDDYVLY